MEFKTQRTKKAWQNGQWDCCRRTLSPNKTKIQPCLSLSHCYPSTLLLPDEQRAMLSCCFGATWHQTTPETAAGWWKSNSIEVLVLVVGKKTSTIVSGRLGDPHRLPRLSQLRLLRFSLRHLPQLPPQDFARWRLRDSF